MNNLTPEENVNCGIITEIRKPSNESEWKDIGKISGIYKIINKVNGKYYVGSSLNILDNNDHGRWHKHKRCLKENVHRNDYLQNAWNKYGENQFNFVIVEQLPNITREELLKIEQSYLEKAKNEQDKCYNLRFAAHSGGGLSEYSRQKIVKSKLGRKLSEETKRKVSESNKGKHGGRKNKNYDFNVYSFKHTNTKEMFVGTRHDFYTKYNLRPQSVRSLIIGRYKITEGWILIQKPLLCP